MANGIVPKHKSTINSGVKWLIITIGLSILLAGLYFYKTNQLAAQAAQSAQMPEPAATVDATEVGLVNFQKKLKLTGEVQAYRQLDVRNELAGKIMSLNAKSGSLVKKGQLLIELDHSDEDARLIAAKAALTLNQQTYKRYSKLFKNKEISEDLLDQAKASVDIAKSNIAVLEASIEKKQITAPFDAKVAIHDLEVGQYLDKNTQVFSLTGINDITWVDFYLPQVYSELALGTQVDIAPMNSNEKISAEIIAVDPQLVKNSRHLKYRVKVATEVLGLKPHTLVNVFVPIEAEQRYIAVPDLAITRDQLGSYVFLLEKNEQDVYRAKKQKVILAERDGEQVMIASGLESGQLIATKGAFKLFPGMKVFISQMTPSA